MNRWKRLRKTQRYLVPAIAVLAGQSIAALWMVVALVGHIEILAWVSIGLFVAAHTGLWAVTVLVVIEYYREAMR